MNNKILVLTNCIRGLYNFRKEVLTSLKEKGYEVVIVAPIKEEGMQSTWFRSKGFEIISVVFNRQGINPMTDLKLMLTYRGLIKRVRPMAVLTYTIKPNLYGGMACALCGVPQIANITGLGAAVEYPGMMQRITIFLYKLGIRKTYLTFFQNDANRKFCEQHNMIKGRHQLIPGSGVDLSYHVQQEYPAESEPIRFIFCSRIRREKGIEEYIATAEAIHAKYPHTEFHVLGGCEGDYEQRLKNLQAKGVLTYHGRQADVRPFFGMGSCTIHPTFYPEGMSNVLLESCATGRPIITTNRPGCREVVDDGINGYIVKEQDSEDLIAKVEAFIHLSYEEKKQMGINARKKVEREFDRNYVINAYLNAVEGIK